ncbi:alpha/beta-hydrolase [Fomitiporia mediterranea MF3/22]|uniref:alpha/beta-hydrolase n=1 Tax=Fomitiporia mediterranea (strain MF3/22) TaxID=694068 RepID=UPI0004407AF1|nr:alpha/beta-hydrolase [Fomitiporia mediterranea MF3/22]EJD08013.1 alpha/beta-hydrolase [Fomitiporia mediterranea MF3/22]
MPNSLTRHVSLNAGSWVLETLVKHYFDQLFKDRKGTFDAVTVVGENRKIRREELLYDEVFHIVKTFLDVSTHHTIEELQQFSNTRTPSAPWMHVTHVRIPMSICNDAARYLIETLGGEEITRRVVGGTKWWQVRGIRGVDAQWIVAKKDYERIKKQRKRQQQQQADQLRKEATENEEEDAVYDPEMDELRCILYFHGGGYYFGSVDQERYFLQRFARKSGCRMLAVSYRLAPQYPFPCAIQDALASYLYLIRPPPDAPHTPVNPAHIIVAGDSAGGGLTLALLQVLRDVNLPMPAGGIPISPWCDLTHSFPSIHINTDTDVIPKYGLSIYKPSVLWPPPSEELTDKVQAGLRSRIKQVAHQYRREVNVEEVRRQPTKRPSFWKRTVSFRNREKREEGSVSRGRSASCNASKETLADHARSGDIRASVVRSISRQSSRQSERGLNAGPTAHLPTADEANTQTLSVVAENGEVIQVQDQVHMYAPNTLLLHPLVSPALGYLGGLPPLLVIVSDGEVLRDEIIYAAHKAAHPERYSVKPEARKLYPKLEGIEERCEPTKVHLQVYDQAAHTLPVLFFACRAAKFCFRAMSIFSRYTFGTLPAQPSPSPSSNNEISPQRKGFRRSISLSASVSRRLSMMGGRKRHVSFTQDEVGQEIPNGEVLSPISQASSPSRLSESSSNSSSLGGLNSHPQLDQEVMRFAGDPVVYQRRNGGLPSAFIDNMIRERVSTRGEIRPLEPEDQLPACTVPPGRVGVASELVLRRYLEGSTKWNERFAKAKETIRKQRAQSLKLARNDTVRNVTQLQMHFFQNADEEREREDGDVDPNVTIDGSVREGLRTSAASWAWAWALDGAEHPPPSSIVARRDTEEARRLSRIADLPADTHDHRMSGNNLWSYLVNKLSLEKSEAKDEQRAVERNEADSNGKEASIDSAGETETTARQDMSQMKEKRIHWPRSLSRTVMRSKAAKEGDKKVQTPGGTSVPVSHTNGNNDSIGMGTIG